MEEVEQEWKEALANLDKAEKLMEQVIVLSGGSDADRVRIRQSFKYAKEDCQDFGIYQLGFGRKRK